MASVPSTQQRREQPTFREHVHYGLESHLCDLGKQWNEVSESISLLWLLHFCFYRSLANIQKRSV